MDLHGSSVNVSGFRRRGPLVACMTAVAGHWTGQKGQMTAFAYLVCPLFAEPLDFSTLAIMTSPAVSDRIGMLLVRKHDRGFAVGYGYDIRRFCGSKDSGD